MIDLRQGDCLEVLRKMEEETIDCVITSPPYDNLRTYNGTLDWNLEKFKEIAIELYRVLKKGGVIVWVVGDATVKGSETGTSFKQALWFMELGFNLHDTMIYAKNNPVPQADKTRYTQAFEYMFVLSKGKPKTVNRITEQCKHIGKVHFGKNKLNEENCDRKTDRAVKETKPKINMWFYNIGNNQSSKDKFASKVPAIFPEQLVYDHIVSWTKEKDVVLDCFMGSGTVGKICKTLNRDFIGIEIVPEYFKIATERIKRVGDKDE